MFYFHYWRRRQPPVYLSCGEFRSNFLKKCIVLNEAQICNGKYKGLANPCVNEEQNAFVLVLHKEATNTQKHTETNRNLQKNTQKHTNTHTQKHTKTVTKTCTNTQTNKTHKNSQKRTKSLEP